MAAETRPVVAAEQAIAAPIVSDNDIVEAEDDDEPDSAYGGSNSQSDWTSVTSSIYKGVFENGRRYQKLREGEYILPADEQQFESMSAFHTCNLLYDQGEKNQLFRSPIGDQATHILDVGTGDGLWATDVADAFPNVTVHGVDLHPPPTDWVPPNCILEVDDVTKEWTYTDKFDLVHLQNMLGAFNADQTRHVYREAYKHLKPGGWIEQIEMSVTFESDDNTIPPNSVMSKWGPMFNACAEKMGNLLTTSDTMKDSIEEAGFRVEKEVRMKYPASSWARDPLYKEIGRVWNNGLKLGLEGYAMFLLTHFGSPEPWTPEEVQILLMQMRGDLDNRKIHAYQVTKRVWAQKPLE